MKKIKLAVKLSVLLTGTGISVSASASEHDSPPPTVKPNSGDTDPSPNSASRSTVKTTDFGALKKEFLKMPVDEVLMSALSDGSDIVSAAAWDALDSRVDATEELQELFVELPEEEIWMKWVILDSLGAIGPDRGVSFLADLALSDLDKPVKHNNVDSRSSSSQNGGEANDSEHEHEHEHGGLSHYANQLVIRGWAAGALVDKYARTGGQNRELGQAVNRVLSTADLNVARATSLELFGHNALTDEHREILQDRGIDANYRIATDEEMANFKKQSAASAW